jgi:hypothetical protein
MKPNLNLAAGALALGLTIPVFATTLPQTQTDHGVTYLSGGVGHDEAAAMKKQMKNYPLSMIFDAGKHNAYLSNVDIAIRGKAGKVVLNTVSDGPYMLVKLPPGRYSITATEDGKTLHKDAQIKSGRDTAVNFHWPTV